MVDTYVGSIDQGTTGTRFMVFDHNGNVVSQAYEKHEQIYPEPGWVEHDSIDIWENTKRVITEALDSEGLDPRQLESIAYQTKDVAEAMVEDADIDLSTLGVDGGAVKNNFLCLLQSNIIGTEIVRPVVDETTALRRNNVW